MKILADKSLPNIRQLFGNYFDLKFYNNEGELQDIIKSSDILICRSTLRVDSTLLQNTKIQCVATASSGTDHIDLKFLQQNNIKLFDAKGINADAVANYVLATIANITQKKLITGNRACVVGMGEVGSRVARILAQLNYSCSYYDPYKIATSNLASLTECDLICIHANLHNKQPYPSFNMFNYSLLKALKPGTTIINAARGKIVNEDDLQKFDLTYCTDVFANEPVINDTTIEKATICTPHIAGHSIEAKANAVIHLSKLIHTNFNMPFDTNYQQNRHKIELDRNWQEEVLSLYNPQTESETLKSASNKTEAFITLRKAHKYRHQFICCEK